MDQFFAWEEEEEGFGGPPYRLLPLQSVRTTRVQYIVSRNIGLALLATDTGQKGCVALVAHPSQRVVDILGTLLGALASLLR